MAGPSRGRRRRNAEASSRPMELYEILNQPLYEDENEDEEDTNFLAMLKTQFPDFGFLQHPVHKYVQTVPDVSKVPLMWLYRARDSAEVLCTEMTNYINFLYHSAPTVDLAEKEDGSSDVRKLIMNSPSADASLERRYMQQRMKALLRLALLLRNSIPVPPKDPADEVSSTEACMALCDVSEKADEAIQTEELDASINTPKSGKEMATTSTQTDIIDGLPLSKSSAAAVDKSGKSAKIIRTPSVIRARASARAPEKPPRKPTSSPSTFRNLPGKLQVGTHSTRPLDKPGSALATKKTVLAKIPERKQRDAAVNAGQITRSAANRLHYISSARQVASGKITEANSSKFASSSNPLNRPKNISGLNLVTSKKSEPISEVSEASSSKSASCSNPSKPDERSCPGKPALRRKKIVGEKSDYRLPTKSSSEPIKKLD